LFDQQNTVSTQWLKFLIILKIKIECVTSASNPASVITLLKNGKNMIDQSEELQYNNSSHAENDQNKNNAKSGKITKSFSTIVVSAEDNESVITCLATNPVISEGEMIS